MSSNWRTSRDGSPSNMHLLESLMWMGRLTYSQLARLMDVDEPDVAEALTQLAADDLAVQDEQGLWQPSGRGRAKLTKQTRVDWTSYRGIPVDAPQLDLLTNASIELLRLGIAAGLGGVALFPLASVEPQLSRTAPHLIVMQLLLDRWKRGGTVIPWIREMPRRLSGPGQQILALGIEALDATMRPSKVLKEHALRIVQPGGMVMMPLWVAESAAARLDRSVELLQEPVEGLWAITDLMWLRQNRVTICDQGFVREDSLFGS